MIEWFGNDVEIHMLEVIDFTYIDNAIATLSLKSLVEFFRGHLHNPQIRARDSSHSIMLKYDIEIRYLFR